MYESLRDMPQEDTLEAVTLTNSAENPASSSSAVKPVSTDNVINDLKAVHLNGTHNAQDDLIPSWDTEFWRTHGNKLRVFGTIEEVCDLSGRQYSQETSKEPRDVENQVESNAPTRGQPSLLKRVTGLFSSNVK